jgi:L-asparaginase
LEHSGIPGYLKSLKNYKDLEFIETIWKDSRDVTDADREKILQLIEKSDAQKVIITHGTFTMADTGKFLKKNLVKKDQVIILTGSMSPLVFENSDAPSNLKFSVEKVNSLAPGVYICMSGRVLDPEEAVKDAKAEKFNSIYDADLPHLV